METIGQGQQVGRGTHDDFRLKIHDHLHLFFGLSAGHWDDRAA
jgi:hypothetical protein